MTDGGIRLLRLGLSTALVASVIGFSHSPGPYISTLSPDYIPLGLFSAVIVLIMIRRCWLDIPWVFGLAVVLALIDHRFITTDRIHMSALSLLGMAGFLVLGGHVVWAEGEEREVLLLGFAPLILFMATESMAGALLDMTERWHPKTFDMFLSSFDSSLHLQIGVLVGRLFGGHQWLGYICLGFYIALPLPLVLIYAAQLRRSRPKAITAVLAFLIAAPLGLLFYNVLPACGPVYLFSFPYHPPSLAQALHEKVVPMIIDGARNAIPSLHMTWLLLLWWNSRGLPGRIRAIVPLFVIFTTLAMLGTGEHYFVDLVVAFPFSLMIQALSSYELPFRDGERRRAFLFGIFVTLIWLALLSFGTRLFWVSPIIPWAMVIGTVAHTVFLSRRLAERISELPAASVAIPTVSNTQEWSTQPG